MLRKVVRPCGLDRDWFLLARRHDGQLLSVQQVPPRNYAVVQCNRLPELPSDEASLIAAIKKIADERMADVRQVHADLVAAPRPRCAAH